MASPFGVALREFRFEIPPDLLRLVFLDVLHCYHLLDNSHQDERVKLQEMRANHVNAIFTSRNKIITDVLNLY